MTNTKVILILEEVNTKEDKESVRKQVEDALNDGYLPIDSNITSSPYSNADDVRDLSTSLVVYVLLAKDT